MSPTKIDKKKNNDNDSVVSHFSTPDLIGQVKVNMKCCQTRLSFPNKNRWQQKGHSQSSGDYA